MDLNDLAHWLLQNAGPCIRFRTLIEILHEQDIGVVSRALNEMLESHQVIEWMTRLSPRFDMNSIHSSKQDAFENVLGKLVQLGVRAGLQPFDNRTLPFRIWLAERVGLYPDAPHAIFLRTLVASFLAFAGYDSTSPVKTHMKRRLEILYEFAKQPDFSDVFVDKSGFKGLPKGSESHKLVNPDLVQNQEFMLPWIHDIRGFSSCVEFMQDMKNRDKLNTIIEMVLSDEYQSLPWSYGLAKYGERYYVLGWAAHLPGYFSRPEGRSFAELLLTLEFMAKFPKARENKWFLDSLEYLESFRTEYETYLFPPKLLPEKKVGYWIGGLRMGFDDRRSYPKSIECESTFRMLKIKQNTMMKF